MKAITMKAMIIKEIMIRDDSKSDDDDDIKNDDHDDDDGDDDVIMKILLTLEMTKQEMRMMAIAMK